MRQILKLSPSDKKHYCIVVDLDNNDPTKVYSVKLYSKNNLVLLVNLISKYVSKYRFLTKTNLLHVKLFSEFMFDEEITNSLLMKHGNVVIELSEEKEQLFLNNLNKILKKEI